MLQLISGLYSVIKYILLITNILCLNRKMAISYLTIVIMQLELLKTLKALIRRLNHLVNLHYLIQSPN